MVDFWRILNGKKALAQFVASLNNKNNALSIGRKIVLRVKNEN
jgi:hypothetical protein